MGKLLTPDGSKFDHGVALASAPAWRTFRKSVRATAFFVGAGNSYEVINKEGHSAILVPGDVLVDTPDVRRTMRVLDFMEMVEREHWKRSTEEVPGGPVELWVMDQVVRLAPYDEDPEVVQVEVNGELLRAAPDQRVASFALRSQLEELKKAGFEETGAIQ